MPLPIEAFMHVGHLILVSLTAVQFTLLFLVNIGLWRAEIGNCHALTIEV
jgi:hypothetical protein